jgi:hypothetical protein
MAPERSYVAANTQTRERLRRLVERLSDDDLKKTVGDGWTVAVALGHVAFWDRRALALLERWHEKGVGPSPLPQDVDVINDALLPFILALPPRIAARLAVETAQALDRELEAMTEASLAAHRDVGSPFGLERVHRREHLEQIEAAVGE